MGTFVRLSRRSVLRGSMRGAAIAFALPPLEAMFNANGTALASGAAIPKRFGLWFWGNGVRLSKWVPATTGPNYVLSDTLAPFAKVKNKMAVVTGFNVLTPDLRAHHSGQAGILTGAPPLSRPPMNGSPFESTFRTASIDQMAAAAIGNQSRFRSIQVGVSRNGNYFEGTNLKHISHNGPDNANPSEFDPKKVFSRLFVDMSSTPASNSVAPVDMTLSLRKSVLDAVLQDLTALKQKVSAADKRRLDQHAVNVREIELRLAQSTDAAGSTGSPAACKKPSEPAVTTTVAAKNKIVADLVAMALACDLTRVFSYQFSSGVDMTIYDEAGVKEPHHQLTHDEGGDQVNVQKICVFMMKQFAYLAEALAAVAEGDSTLLDSCAIFGTTDCAEGQPHSLTNYPMLVLGGAGGKLKTGIHHRGNGDNATSVPLSLLRAVGVNIAELGQGNGRATAGCTAIEA